MTERVLTQAGFRPRRWRYRWNGFDRLVGLETPDGARWRYTYDAFGRRVGKVLLDEPHRRVDYVWQGQAIAEAWHRGGDGPIRSKALHIERWHFEPDGVRPLAKELVGAGDDGAPARGDTELLPILADQVGAPCAVFNAEGTCRWRAEPELWGRTRTARDLMRERHGEAGRETDETSCALRFPGQWEDAESGLHYNLNRYYDPETGQYLSPDPIGVEGGRRTHAYVHDPLRWIDPTGLASCRSNWKDWFSRQTKTEPPAGMPDPHAHHIVFKGDFSRSPKMQAALARSRAVMEKYGIDPVNDPDALMWAPNEAHSVANARSVASRLEAADARISQQNLSPSAATQQMKVELQKIGQDIFGWP
jgi:RHS repeat-associated protein